MKKLMALALALVMALSCASALAQDTPALASSTTEMSLTVNEELLSALLGASMTEEDAQLIAMIMPLLNNLGAKSVVTENGMQAELTLKGTPIATAVGAAGENELVLLSDLFPSYALTLPVDAMAQAGTISPDALLQTLEAQMSLLAEGISAYAGQPETGEFTLEGEVFNVKQPYEMTQKEMGVLTLTWVKGLMAEEALAPLFASIEGFDAAAIDEALAQLESLTEEDLIPVNMATYALVDAQGQQVSEDAYFTAEMGDDENVLAVAMGMVQGSVYVHVNFGAAIYTSMDEMRQAAAEGSGEAMVMDMVIVPGQSENDATLGLDLYLQGMYVGLALQSAQTDAGLAQDMALYFMTNQAPLLSLSCVTVPGGEITAGLTAEGKTVLSLEEIAADEEGTLSGGLLLDVTSYGLNNLIANAAIAMPDEVTALVTALTAMTAPVEGTTDVPVEGVTE